MSVYTSANAIVDKAVAKLDAIKTPPDITALETLVKSMGPEASKYVDATVTTFSTDIDSRCKMVQDAITASTSSPLMKKRAIADATLPKYAVQNQIATIFSSFDDSICDFGRNTLVRYAQMLNDAQTSCFNDLQARINELRSRLIENLNNYMNINEEHIRVVNEATRFWMP